MFEDLASEETSAAAETIRNLPLFIVPLPKYPNIPTLAYNLYLDAGGANADETPVLHSAALVRI
jgi:hypothetical protein